LGTRSDKHSQFYSGMGKLYYVVGSPFHQRHAEILRLDMKLLLLKIKPAIFKINRLHRLDFKPAKIAFGGGNPA
jgi:hypothetical protein